MCMSSVWVGDMAMTWLAVIGAFLVGWWVPEFKSSKEGRIPLGANFMFGTGCALIAAGLLL